MVFKIISLFLITMMSLTGVSAMNDSVVDVMNDSVVDIGEQTQLKVKEYKWGEQFGDKIKLMFTWKQEKREQLMDRIEQKRELHYNHLMMKGKEEQANSYKERHQLRESIKSQEFEEKKEMVQQRIKERVENVEHVENNTQKEKEEVEDETEAEEEVEVETGHKEE